MWLASCLPLEATGEPTLQHCVLLRPCRSSMPTAKRRAWTRTSCDLCLTSTGCAQRCGASQWVSTLRGVQCNEVGRVQCRPVRLHCALMPAVHACSGLRCTAGQHLRLIGWCANKCKASGRTGIVVLVASGVRPICMPICMPINSGLCDASSTAAAGDARRPRHGGALFLRQRGGWQTGEECACSIGNPARRLSLLLTPPRWLSY